MSVPASAVAPSEKMTCPALPGRFAHFLVACVLAGLAVGLGNPNYRWSDRRDVPYGADFLQEWVAGDMILGGAAAQVYDATAFAERQHDAERVGFTWPEREFYPAVYPPPYYCLIAPLGALPYWVAVPVWLAMMLGAYSATVWLIERAARQRSDSSAYKFPIVFWSVALLFPALFMGLVMGQKGTLWLWLAAASWLFLRAGKPWLSGCSWALLMMKPTLCFVLPLVMLFHLQWRFVWGVVVGTLALYCATAIVLPASMWSDYWQVAAGSVDYQSHGGYRGGWSASLLSLLRACGCPRAVTLAIWLLAAAGMLAALVKLPRVSIEQKLQQPDFQLRIFLSTALLSPHFYFYDLVWLLLPIRGLLNSEPRRAIAIMAAVWLSILAVQPFDHGWPLLSITLLMLLLHSTFLARGCGTSFACTDTDSAIVRLQ